MQLGDSNLCGKIHYLCGKIHEVIRNKIQVVNDRSNRKGEHEEIFPVVPSKGKYVYIGGLWSLLGTPMARPL